MPLTIAQPTGGSMSSLDAGTQTAPPVNTIICDSGLLGAGNSQPTYWIAYITTYQSGTPDANASNMLVNVGGTNSSGVVQAGTGNTIGKLLSTAASIGVQTKVRIVIPAGGGHVYICSGNTVGGGGAVYNAAMSLTKVDRAQADI